MKMIFNKSFIAGLFLLTGTSFGQDTNCVYLASDVYPGSYGSLPNNLTPYNGALYFSSTGNGLGVELWKYENGTSSMVADINPGLGGSMPNELIEYNGDLYFSASTVATGMELYTFDGVSVSLVADIWPGVTGSFVNKLTVIGAELYFVANDGVNGVEPWKYDGVSVSMVADINPGSNSSGPQEIEGWGGFVFFRASSDATGMELWKYDGVSTVVFDLYPGINGSDIGELTAIPSHLCFRATDGVLGYELWTYNGVSLVNLNVNPTSDFTPWELTAVGSELLFRGFIAATGYELWKFDGTSASLVMDIRPGGPNSNPNNLTAVGTSLVFAANDGVIGNELWKYDGTSTFLVADIRPGASGSMPAPSFDKFGVISGHVFVVASNASSGSEVFRYDGSSTILSKDVNPGGASSTPTGLKGFGTTMYWTADNGVVGGELWAWNTEADLTESITVYTCSNYTSPAGNLYSTPGTYNFVDIIPSVHCPGCDSIITVDLTITDAPASSLVVNACNDYTSPGGTYYNTPGTYTVVEIFPSINCPGLDSTVTIDLTLADGVSTAVVVFSGVILAQESGGIYQWLDCDNGYAVIPGETDQDFLPTVTGNYACEITIGCTDTTNCYYVFVDPSIGFSEETNETILIYPNPANDVLFVRMNDNVKTQIKICDNLGNEVLFCVADSYLNEIDLTSLSAGVYFIHVSTESSAVVQRFVKY